MKTKEVIEKAYGNVPKDPLFTVDLDFSIFRPFKYYWLKLKRFFTR